MPVARNALNDCRFKLSHWYAKKQAQLWSIRRPTKLAYLNPIGDTFCREMKCLLTQGINNYFPNTEPCPGTWAGDRFFVHLKNHGSSTYIVIDEDFNLTYEIDRTLLENSAFDLIGWHLNYLMRDNVFYTQY